MKTTRAPIRPSRLARSLLRFAFSVSLGIALCLGSPLHSAAEPPPEFIGLRKCNVCHGKELMGDQVAAWRNGPHASAVATLATPESLEIAERLGLSDPPQKAKECLSCHSTGHRLPAERMAYPVEVSDGVQCESCHGAGAGYRKKKVMSDRKKAEAAGLLSPEKDVAICTRCHNQESPTFDPERYTLPDGSRSGFDFAQALERVVHPIPEHVKGRYVELEREKKEAERRGRAAGL